MNNKSLFLEVVKSSFLEFFPNGFFYAIPDFGFNKDRMIISFGLINGLEDCPNRIRENDPLYSTLTINEVGDKFYTEWHRGSLFVNPPKGSFLAMGSVKTKMRKTTGDLEKLENSFYKYFKGLKAKVDENKDNVYGASKLSEYL